MPLILRIKPEGKLFVSGTGWIKNVGTRTIQVLPSEGLAAQRENRIVKRKDIMPNEGMDYENRD